MNNRIIKTINYSICICLLLGIFSSCQEEEVSPRTLIYIRSLNQEVALDGYYNSDNKLVIVSKDTLRYLAHLTRELSQPVDVNLVVDQSAVAKYNEENETEYTALPQDALVTDIITIPEGEVSVDCALEVDANKIEVGKTYLVPLRLNKVDTRAENVSVSNNTQLVFFKISVNIQNMFSSDNDLEGTIIADRSAWAFTASDFHRTSNEIETLIDGSTITGWRGMGEKDPMSTVTIDINTKKAIKGFKITMFSNAYGRYVSPSIIAVSMSADGDNWDDYGDIALENEKEFYNIGFYNVKDIRYIRLGMKDSKYNFYGVGFSELDLFE